MQYWRDEFTTGFFDPKGLKDVSPSQTSTIVSILSAGTFFGALTAAPLADYLGRRLALITSCGVFSFGVILQTASTALPMFIAGRFFAGFGVGLVSALSMRSPPSPLHHTYHSTTSFSVELRISEESRRIQSNMMSRAQFHSTNPKRLLNGSAASSWAHISSPSPSASFSLPLSTTPRKTVMILVVIASQLLYNLLGLSSWSPEC